MTKRILLTGPPGVGKTTLTKKVCDILKEKVSINGFYTQERRVDGQRQGFDVVTLDDGKTSTLATKSDLLPGARKKSMPTVGQYSVDLISFENTGLPVIQTTEDTGILIIDEIGKMELLSRKFVASIRKIFDNTNINILATIPSLERGKPPAVVLELTKREDVKIVAVSKNNRENLVHEIVQEYMEHLQ